jgi:glycosyltransferase involved in cell wall biosynthesis
MWWVVLIFFVSAILFQLGWYFCLYRVWKNHRFCIGSVHSSLPPVSIIVCAHNELSNLQELLPLLYQQQYSTFEIVVVEDTSYDDTLDFLLAQKEQHPTLKIVWLRERPEHVGGKKYALTLGIRAASYNHLLLTDADCRPASDHWIQTMMQSWNERCDFLIGYSPYQTRPGLLNSFIRYETLHTGMMYLGAAIRGYPYMGVGRNLAYQKLFFLERKGFRGFWHVTGGDDDLFVNRHATAANTVAVIHPEAHTYSIPKPSWRAFVRQKIRHLSVGKLYKRRDKRWLGVFSATTIVVWVGWSCLVVYGEWLGATVLLLLRWIMMGLALRVTSEKLGDPITLIMLPIFDFLFVIYYISIGPTALLSKHIRWK